MSGGEWLAALVSAAVVQLLNTWKLWMKVATIDTRLTEIEEKLDSIGHFRVSRDITGGRP